MTEQFSPPSAAFADHRVWKQEHNGWRTDIVLWQQEYSVMRAAIQALEQAVERHGEALCRHAAAINEHEATLDLSERMIAEQETEHERPGHDVSGIDQHQRLAMAQLAQRQVQERMKREHHRLVAQLEMLDSILSE